MPSIGSKNGSTSYFFRPKLHVPWLRDQLGRLRKHLRFLISNGLHGIVITGTNGEESTPDRFDRTELLITIGRVVGYTRDSIRQTMEAREPNLAAASPIPLVAGLNNSETLDLLGQYKNIVAVNLACDGQAKFIAPAGQSDWLMPALNVGGVGTIVGVATKTISTSRENTLKRPLYRSSSVSPNENSPRAKSTAPSLLLHTKEFTPKAAPTAGTRIRSIPTQGR
ncbi:hypothetical protein GGP41_002667 [Bipolaris sorokiniana]|uniref:Uncharacterized protein n=1 Tax=Cochliobolus sativus TaxID=45130 RepID=A0A8H6DWI7_COCSA|nr:hypothetical protein GGP41_002667 [Bipolaris sorokiniana]